jgi:hypothetical protein
MEATVKKYRPTESKYKGGATEMYVAYDVEQRTRAGNTALIPKVKRVYIAGNIKGWKKGTFKKRSGREVYGIVIEYEQTRQSHPRQAYAAKRNKTDYKASPTTVTAGVQVFKQIVEVPEKALNAHFYAGAGELPAQYKHALQNIR